MNYPVLEHVSMTEQRRKKPREVFVFGYACRTAHIIMNHVATFKVSDARIAGYQTFFEIL